MRLTQLSRRVTQFTCDVRLLDIFVERQECYERLGETLAGFHAPDGVTKRRRERKGEREERGKMMEDVISLKRLNSGDR